MVSGEVCSLFSISQLNLMCFLVATDSDVFEFYIVSLDGKQWHFEAASCEERDEWVADIEQEIFKSLQGNESSKTKLQSSSEIASMQSIRTRVPGNGSCVDCDAQSKSILLSNLTISLYLNFEFLSNRSRMGQFESRHINVH